MLVYTEKVWIRLVKSLPGVNQSPLLKGHTSLQVHATP